MRRFFTLIKKELKAITKEKTIMFAIIIQFLIASFSSIILVGIMSFYDPASISQNTQITIKVGVVGETSNPLIWSLMERNLTVVPFSSVTEADNAFKYGHVDTIVYIPESDDGVVDMKLVLPESDTMGTVILMVLNEPLKEYENFLRAANGVQLNYQGFEGKPHTTYEFLYSIIIPILMLFPAFIAGSIVIDTVSEEIENKTLDTLWSAPVSLNQVFASKISAAIITTIIQCILWVALLRFNSLFMQNIGLVLLLSIIIAALISIGAAIIGLYFKDRERAQFAYSVVLVAAAGISYLFNPSPFSLITRLATGDHFVGIYDVALYLLPLVVLSGLFIVVAKKLLLMKS